MFQEISMISGCTTRLRCNGLKFGPVQAALISILVSMWKQHRLPPVSECILAGRLMKRHVASISLEESVLLVRLRKVLLRLDVNSRLSKRYMEIQFNVQEMDTIDHCHKS